MTDYGHELEFGIFPTPDAAAVQRTLELAQLADVRGLDLVTIQDHPYQARHLDAWTLLTVIGARTSSVRIAPNVANLPLRPPVVLARSVATLDQLTGGRAELGLGAGAFWEAIAAAGGPKRSPGEAVVALAEAIEVIRATWGRGTIRTDGVHYPVHGLHAGPQPLHDVGIWLGAYKPRMLRMTGRLGDGWLPSMGYADPPALAGMNAVIDEAALASGRSPHDIRRLYNITGRPGAGDGWLRGGAADWAEQLAGLTLEHGMSTFILGTDDPTTVRVFADEVAPATRELVAAERAHTADGRVMPATTVAPVNPVTSAPAQSERLQVTPTPDSGARLRTEQPWDERTRPVYAGPADTSYTLEQQGHPRHLIDVHDALRAELTQLRDVLDQVRRGQRSVGDARSVLSTMTMRQNNWTLGAYCAAYCRIVTGHHSLEDRSMFPHLRRAEPAVVPVLERLEAEHVVIHDLLDRVDQALVGLVGDEQGAPATLEGLQLSVDVLTDALLSHLAYEERELLHPLARHGLT